MDKEILNSNEDVDAILKLAIRRNGGGVESELRDRLQRSAGELGISEAELDAAVEEYRIQKKARRYEQLMLKQSASQVLISLAVNAGLVGVWLFGGPSEIFWPIFPIVFYLGSTLIRYFKAKKPIDLSDPNFTNWLANGEPNDWSIHPEENKERIKA